MHDSPADHGPSLVHRTYFDPRSVDHLPRTIVRAISTVENRSPAELAPLYDAIDVDALERLLEHSAATGSELGARFSVDGWDMRVTGSGEVLVYDDPHDCDRDASESRIGADRG